MAANNGLHVTAAMDDEESHSNGGKIQPVSSTPGHQNWVLDIDKKQQVPPTLGDLLGVHELFSLDVWRASIGELVGTAVLVFMLDTIVISTIEADIKIPNLVLSVLAAIIITILLLAVHPVSGGHINPIISFSAALVGLISLSRALIYIIAQSLGGVLGALALKAVVSSKIEQGFSLGGCTLTVVAPGPNGPITIGLETAQALWLEIFCSFIFLFASIWMAYDHRQAKELGHILIFSIVGTVLGLLVFVSTSVTTQKGYAGAGMNPARCIGPAIVRGGHLWDGHWVFWVGPAVACVAFYLYTKIIPRQHHKSKGYEHDFSKVVKVMFGGKSM
ncbi:Aquaporin (major intrinsic protein family) [Handroanthus impetiginosus]|uniref:Aquaporin (Major intrinsic protein family) n=1 Tax=Handroanthus impetiginosus TaxID=429701 RepID=A0A2G9H9S0_9LAMI|nr:Aquaporin (major intrinsic protein family) [Handroanthus impetiginosus]